MFEIERIWQIIVAVLLAAAGGFARLLKANDKTRLKWSEICSELFISAFAGLMVLMLARNFQLSGDWIGLVCGISGWIGPRILDLIAKPAGKAIGINVDTQHDAPAEKHKEKSKEKSKADGKK